MEQNKIDYQETYPNCLKCGEIIKESNFKITLPPKAIWMDVNENAFIESVMGEVVSVETYEGLKGLCNNCIYETEGMI